MPRSLNHDVLALNMDKPSDIITTLTAAIVFTDVEGFTAKMAEDERHTLKLVKRDFALMRQYCQQFGGKLLKSLGDGLLLSFQTAEAAVQWALTVQQSLTNAAASLPDRDILWHRIGIHLGEVFFSQEDVMGAGVNLAARLQTQSPAGGVALSQPVYDAVNHSLTVEILDLGEQPLKGLAEPIRIYQIPPYRVLMKQQQRWRKRLPTALAAGALATGLILGIRATGLMQRWELRAFDLGMRMRPAETVDDRLFLVTVTEADVQSQPAEERRGVSLSDRALSQLLAKLEQGQPRSIGLDIYREQAADPAYPRLTSMLAEDERIFAICHYGEAGVPPSPEIAPERQGFNNVQLDVDNVLRRQVLAVGAPEPCQNWFSFNWMLAMHYLAAEGVDPVPHEQYLQLGDVLFPRLTFKTGGYYGIDDGGQQVMLNYRAAPQIAPRATLAEVLDEQFDVSAVRDRIVMIGTVAPSFNDHNWTTPYSGGWGSGQPMTGVEIQAHMTSQILSAVLDDRPLLWSWSEPIEMLWIGGWALTASLIAVQLRSRRWLGIYLGGMVIILTGICWVVICFAGWIPFVPAALAIALSGVMINIYRHQKAKRAFKS